MRIICTRSGLGVSKFPRKLKKKIIKLYSREVYKGLLDGTYILSYFKVCLPPNQNNRIYPLQHLKDEVEAWNKTLKNNPKFGELSHPTKT